MSQNRGKNLREDLDPLARMLDAKLKTTGRGMAISDRDMAIIATDLERPISARDMTIKDAFNALYKQRWDQPEKLQTPHEMAVFITQRLLKQSAKPFNPGDPAYASDVALLNKLIEKTENKYKTDKASEPFLKDIKNLLHMMTGSPKVIFIGNVNEAAGVKSEVDSSQVVAGRTKPSR